MADEHAPQTAHAALRPPRRHRALRWLGGTLAVLLGLVLLAAGALWWTLAHERGTAWLLSRLPGVQVVKPHGGLLGDFGADLLVLHFGQGGELRLVQPAWQGLSVGRSGARSAWARVAFDRLQAQQARLVLPASPQTKPKAPPSNLALPVELVVQALQIDELQLAPLGDEPLRKLQARGIHLLDHEGEVHRIDAVSVERGPLHAEGRVRVQVQAPMQAEVALALRQAALAGWPAWRAQAQLVGPLAEAALRGSLRTDTPAPQTLALDATVRPFADWPVARLNAQARRLDLSALLAGGPQTALSGDIVLRAADGRQPLQAQVNLVNAEPGAWDAGRVPVRQLQLALGADPRDRTQLQLQQLQAELGNADQPAGRVSGEGRWSAAQGWSLQAVLQQLRPERLHASAPALLLDGRFNASGHAEGAAGQPPVRQLVDLDADLTGNRVGAGRQPPLRASLRGGLVSGADGHLRIELQRLEARQASAKATLQGWAQRDTAGTPWRTEASLALDDFDPRAWWPATGQQPSRLNAKADAALTLPPAGPGGALLAWLSTLQGRVQLQLDPSTLAGVPLQGEARLQGSGSAEGLQVRLQAEAAGNHVQADGRLARDPARDHWQARVEAPALQRLAALLPGHAALSGTVQGELSAQGRWPRLSTQGQLQARQLVAPSLQLARGDAHWRMGTAPGAPVDLRLDLADLQPPGGEKARRVSQAQLQVDGTASDHRIALQATLAAAPPAWTEATQPASPATGPRTLARLQARGGLLYPPDREGPADIAGWRGRAATLDLRRAQAAEPLLHTADLALEWRNASEQKPAHLNLEPGRAQVAGGVLRWSRLHWQAAQGTAPAQVEADITLEPMRVAPLLARLQPAFGWQGDLAVAGRLQLHTAPVLRANLLLQRQGGDLRMARAGGITSLGLDAMRVSVQAEGTRWTAQARVAGKVLGSLQADLNARTSPSDPWPRATTPMQGTLALRAAELGVYDPWLPVGWRLGGTLTAEARLGGRLGAPQYSGRVQGRQLAVSNFVEGVRLRNGELDATLQGDQLQVQRFVLQAGDGVARIAGHARLGAQPGAQLTLNANRFQALSRVDRRIALSGEAALSLDAQRTRVQGSFAVDDGLIDLGQGQAPELSKDVRVVDDPRYGDHAAAKVGGGAKRKLDMDLRIALGDALRVQGRGVNTLLGGTVHVTAPEGQLQLHGSVHTVKGTYEAYGEKLDIERGVISFHGPAADPRLDIQAMRSGLKDVEVGVSILGSAQNPTVKLISTPEMSELDKLSWLVMGRASEGLATDQSALLQRAALALVAGQRGGGGGEGVAKRLGLDALSVSRGASGGFNDAVVTLGKQLSERFYVGYHQSLDATGVGWEMIYKIAKQFTVRVQTGETTAVDLVWTWLWG